MDFKPSDEQLALADAAKDQTRDTIFVDACAGSGKSSTMRWLALKAIPRQQSVLFTAFNRIINDQAWQWIKGEGKERRGLYSRSFNGMGAVILRYLFREHQELKLVSKKYDYLVADLMAERFVHLSEEETAEAQALLEKLVHVYMFNTTFRSPDQPEPVIFGGNDASGQMTFLPSNSEDSAVLDALMTRYGLFGLESESDMQRVRECLSEVLKRGHKMLKENGQFDFVDQVFWPVKLAGNSMVGLQRSHIIQPSDVVITDEAQDLSPLERALVTFFIRRNSDNKVDGRFFAVGDPNQAIYGFRGADTKGFENTKTFLNASKVYPLSYSWRCSKRAAARAAQWKPGFKVPDTAVQGEERFVTKTQLIDEAQPDWALVHRTRSGLVNTAMALFMAKKKFAIMGNIDFGAKLTKPIKTVAEHKDYRFEKLVEFLNAHCERTIERRRRANKPEREIAEFRDEINSTLAAIELVMQLHADIKDTDTLIQRIEEPFGSSTADDLKERIKLFTGHGIKGMEFDTVVNCTPEQFPLAWDGQTKDELEQEMNLKYVVETRVKRVYLIVDEKAALKQHEVPLPEDPRPPVIEAPTPTPAPPPTEADKEWEGLTLGEKVQISARRRERTSQLLNTVNGLTSDQLSLLSIVAAKLATDPAATDSLRKWFYPKPEEEPKAQAEPA